MCCPNLGCSNVRMPQPSQRGHCPRRGTERARIFSLGGLNMESIVGIFNSLADARRAAAMLRTFGITEDRITVLSPHTPQTEIEARIPATDTEQPGMGQALGGTVGGALGVAGGATAGAAASLLVPGV